MRRPPAASSNGSRAWGSSARTMGSPRRPRRAAAARAAAERGWSGRGPSTGFAPGGDVDLAVGAARRGRPVGRAMDEQAVAQRHSAEADRVLRGGAVRAAHALGPRIRCGSCQKKPAIRWTSATAIRSSGGVDQWLGLGEAHRVLGAEAVDGRAEGLAEPVTVGKAGHHARQHLGAGIDLGDPCLDRLGERAAVVGAVAPTTCSTNSTSCRSPSPSTWSIRSRTSASSISGGTRQSTKTSAREGITFCLPVRVDHRRARR